MSLPSQRPDHRSVRPRASVRPADESGVMPVAAALPSLLIVDDDPMVRRALARVLRRRYVITELESAEAALDLLDAGDTFDAIVCDLNLDGMSGRNFLVTLDAMRDIHADRVIILSGTARDAVADERLEGMGPRFVEKPATAAQIEVVIAAILREHANAA